MISDILEKNTFNINNIEHVFYSNSKNNMLFISFAGMINRYVSITWFYDNELSGNFLFLKDDEKNYTKPNSNYVKNGYVRPKTTFTDNLTPDKIEELLEDYGEKPIEEIPLGTHVRYFVKDNGESKFRIGGFLNDINGLPDYVRLRAGPNMENTWNVQVKNAIFYKKLSIKEIKQEYDKIVDDYIEKIKKLKSKIKDYEKTYKIK